LAKGRLENRDVSEKITLEWMLGKLIVRVGG